MNMEELGTLALQAETESTRIDFKSSINWSVEGELNELIKDIIAIANTGGGCILIGVNDNGSVNNDYICDLHAIDHSTICNRIKKYTNVEFGKFEISMIKRNEKDIMCICIAEANKPIVFEKPGTYQNPKEPEKQKTAFAQGTVYFRHGAKSETCNNNDIVLSIDNELERIRDSWLGNIRKVVEAPIGHVVHMLPPNVVMKETDDATAIRITDDENAPAYKLENPDRICPFRQKDVLKLINERLPEKDKINQYDIQVITHVHSIDSNKPNYFYKSLYGPKQYSQEFINWVLDEYNKNNEFFLITREKYKIGNL